METIAPVAAVGAALVAWHQALFRWPAVVGLLISIMLFVPIGRYSIPVNLPFGLELYRVAVALVLAGWAAALLVDPRVRLRRSPFQVPLLIIVCATLGSLGVNVARVAPLGPVVLKAITFFLSFVLVHYLLISVVRTRRSVENVTKVLVTGTAVVAVFSIVEQRIGFNVFDHVGTGHAISAVQRHWGGQSPRRYSCLWIVWASNRARRGARHGAPARARLGVWLWPTLGDPDGGRCRRSDG